MSAVVNAHRAIQNGDGEIFIAGGVEGMTRGPWIISKTSSAFGRDAKMFDSTFGWRFINPLMERNYGCDSMGQTAENLAKMYQISREDQDLFAYNSQMKYNNALKSNRFEKEIGAIEVQSGKKDTIWMVNDEFPKPATTPEKLSMLKPAFDVNGTVTAGNSSGLNDGAAALLIVSEKVISQQNLQPIARIVSNSVVGVEPRIMGIGPVEASKRALDKAGLRIGEMDIIELNEAFAAQVLACTRNLGLEDEDPRLNPNGGAIALGHPLGMSGARLILTAAKELQVRQKKYALCSMCIGVGQGYAVILERV